MKKQDHIRQEKRIIDLIEQLDNKKVFNSLKEDYLKEKMKISKGYYLNRKDKKKDYFSNLINLEKCSKIIICLCMNIPKLYYKDFLGCICVYSMI